MIYARAVYFLFFAAGAVFIPFLSLYYDSLGMNGTQIGILTGIVPFVTLASAPLWGSAADASGRHKLSMLAAIGGAWLAGLIMSQMASFIGLLPAVIIFAFFLAPIVPLIDNTVLGMLGDHKSDYGRIRLWGGIGWGLAALAIGPVLQRAGLSWSFYAYLILMAATWVATSRLPERTSESLRVSWRKGLSVMGRNGQFLILLVVALAFGIGLGVMMNYLFLYIEDLGGSKTLMAISLTVASVSEVPIWFISGRLLQHFGRFWMIVIALTAMAIRMFGYAFMGAVWWVLPLSLLHGPSFALLWAAGVAGADAFAPHGLGATAQGLFSGAMLGLGAGTGALLGGILFDAVGPVRLFQLAGWLMVLTLVFIFVARALPRNRVPKTFAGETSK